MKAEVDYRKALEKNSRNPQAEFNLGNALLAQQKDSAAIVAYERAAKIEINPLRKAMSYHNIGVICQGHRLFGEAIEAYKNALRLNPKDDETRYNLELCKRQLKQQRKKPQKNKKNNSGKNQKNQNNKNDKQKQQKNKSQSSPDKMSRENAEQLLNAVVQQERSTQERLKKAMQQPRSRNLQKNW